MTDHFSDKTSGNPKITLEQWRCLVAVVESGSYAQAAQLLHKSQSSVSYAIQKMESVLGATAFTISGRRAVLTTAGQMLYRHAKQLLDDASTLELAARRASAGWESQVSISVEVLFPMWLLLDCLAVFNEESPQTRVEVFETVISGALEGLQEGRVDFAIDPRIPSGYNGELLPSPARVIPVAHPSHPLHQLERTLTLKDLRHYRHLLVRDSNPRRGSGTLTVEVAKRWTLSNVSSVIGAACKGYGFSWLPEEKILNELSEGKLKPLPLQGGSERVVPMYLIFPNREDIGPGAQRLAEIIRQRLGKRDSD
ncbi:LysR family transcriptional regulator [Microbulbifer sp. OS29]|uniref:LysR family transcriptional regulator n=1 Tax=Microbulbifer okhotskensis TaxID=2926617 RepID=A0A9X2J7Y9_9GAMM|nr:LysR family transcriptional regulator [Microbulbifer okhotskensis]MCO1334996.1 LysR family transcriptional regulator [Microbulbifer okhotskensis]